MQDIQWNNITGRILSMNILKVKWGKIKGGREATHAFMKHDKLEGGVLGHPPETFWIFTFSVVGFRVKSLQVYTWIVGMGDYENMSQRLLFLQVSRLLRLLATLHMYVDFIQQSNWYLLFVE